MSTDDVTWSSSFLEDLLVHVIGGDWGKDENHQEQGFVNVSCIRGSEFKNWNKDLGSTSVTRKVKSSSLETRRLLPGDVLVEISGGGPDQPVGRTVLITDEVLEHLPYPAVCTNFLRLARPHELIDSSFFNHYLKNFYLSGEVTSYQGGSNNLRNLKFKEYSKIRIPVPSQAEQKAIADKLDTLLTQVESTKARLERTPQILKRFRQSVLAAAVSGRLTEEWRTTQGKSLNSWQHTTFQKICREVTVGFVGRMANRYEESGIPFLRSQNVRAFKFSDNNLLYISTEFHREIYKSRLEPGDLAIVRSGAPGTTCVIPKSLGVANCSDLVIARPSRDLNPAFGCIFMNSEVAQKNVSENQVGVAQQHFNVGSMKKMPIYLPPVEEQTEIVRRVEQLFAYAERIEQRVSNALGRVNNLTQSILAKAFRGELTEQWRIDNPDLISGQNSAEALLERIKAERLETKPAKRKSKKTLTA